MQIYYDKNGSGTTERNQLLLRNYASDSGPDTWTASGGVYERDAHDHGVFLHRLISMNAIQGMNVSSRPTPSQGARFRRAQSLVLTSEPLELGPGEYAILTSKFFADVTADGYGNEYMSFDYTNPTKVSDPSMNNSNFDTGRGFIVDLLAVSDWKNPSPSAPNRTAAQWHIVEPIPVNTPGRLVVRFYNESYGESGAKAAYAGQGKFLLGLSRGDRMVEVGSGSNDVIFMDPAVSIDESDLQVDLGDPLLLLNNPADFAWFGWRNEETEGGSKPLYSVLNPRLMANTNFLGLNLSRTQAVLAETFYELGGSYEPQVGAGPDGRKLVHAGGSYDASGQTSLVLYDVPRQPARSIADFMHANISFFDVMPSYAIGNSFASPYFDTSEYAAAIDNKKLGRDVLLPDLSYLSNDALFDEYFLSTIPVDLSSAPVVGYSKYTQSFFDSLPPYEKVDAGFIESGKLLPNSRLLFMRDGSESPLAYLDELRDFRTAGSKLILDGAFNVNSTSVAAWTGFLGGVKALSDLGYYETATGSEGTLSSSALAYSFMRFATPSGKENDEWRGFRALSGDEIVELAENIVSEVKARGPFLSMADFVNRRLTRGSTGEKGALQAAIDASSINSSFGGSSSLAGAVGTYVPPAPKAGLPGFLLQNDVLRVLGPQMAVRSDTFKVRAYGESRNAVTGLVEGRAMCEAVVQRVPEWVDPINASEDDIYVDAPNGDYDSALSAINQSFGRRFKLISFRWMNDQEMP